MALSNSQYDAIMREYGKQQMENQHSQEARKKEIYQKVPAVKELEAEIAPNLYLCKVAMDIVAKHVAADQDGVRIAELDEMSYRQMLWDHRPLTDFWRVGKGYARKLEENGIYTMG